MQTYRVVMRDLLYNPDETSDQFRDRKQCALEDGRMAVRERRISGDLYLFYEYLVDRVGSNRYTWVAEDTLAEVFGRDESTIKRWIAKLVSVGLIRRQRQFGSSSRTYIVTYDPTTVMLDSSAPADEEEITLTASESHPSTQTPSIESMEDQGSHNEDLSFGLNHEPSISSHLRQDHIKYTHLNLGGGGKDINVSLAATTQVVRLLEQEDVEDFYIAPTLRQLPYDELRAVSDYLDKQPNVRNRARLFASLAARRFGAELLAGREQKRRKRDGSTRRSCQPDDHLKYVSGALATYIQGWQSGHNDRQETSSLGNESVGSVDNSALVSLWQSVLDGLKLTLSAGELATWFADTGLFSVDGDRAIVLVSNILAKEKLTSHYAPVIRQALSDAYQRPVQVQIELGA